MFIKLIQNIGRSLINIRVFRKTRDQREVRRIRSDHHHVGLDVLDELKHHFHCRLVVEGEVYVGDVHDRDVALAVREVMQRLDPRTLVGAEIDVVDVGERRGLVIVQEGRGGQAVARLEHAHGLLQRLRGRVFLEYIPADFAVFLNPAGEALRADLDMELFNGSHGGFGTGCLIDGNDPFLDGNELAHELGRRNVFRHSEGRSSGGHSLRRPGRP